MTKNKNIRKLSAAQVVFYVLCALVVVSMILAAISN